MVDTRLVLGARIEPERLTTANGARSMTASCYVSAVSLCGNRKLMAMDRISGPALWRFTQV